jgi:microcystin-dependent protein
MATFKITDLTNTDTPALSTMVPCVQQEQGNYVTKQLSVFQIKQLFDVGTFKNLTAGSGIKTSSNPISVSGSVSFHCPGLMCLYAGQGGTPPSGWLFCDGSPLSTTTYSDLFAALGYRYGGSGSTFNLPNPAGRALCGLDNMGGTSANVLTQTWAGANRNVLGGTTGTISHQLTNAQIPLSSHNHTVSGTFNEQKFSGGRSGSGYCGNQGNVEWNIGTHPDNGPGSVTLNLTVSSPTSDASAVASSVSHPHLPPFLLLRYIIKT